MVKQLYYFDAKGFGEPIRYLLHYGKIEFEDVRTSHKEWPELKNKISPPFGKLPIFKDGERTLNQSMAIARYIGRVLDLVPTDPWEEASVDAVILTLNDFNTNISAAFHEQDPAKKEALIKVIVDETIDFYFSRFEKMLKENNGHFGKKLTWADFVFVNAVEVVQEHLKINIKEKYPSIQELTKKVYSLPGVKEYIAKRDS